ncbi:F-box only protein 15 isoform X2 [Brachyhypopomus gauderio]|uniref:F-box only protein 15 isoform X2 n=1 Tax=Brachyhypopomus gauderio TaxID=698409 RepID=UPI0040423418
MSQRSSRCPGAPQSPSVKGKENFIERMPPEVILKILSCLDAGSLFCVGLVSKRFQELASNNALWYQLYTCQRAKNKRPTPVSYVTDAMGVAGVQEKPKGYWRTMLFKDLTGYNEKWKRKLKAINYYTGLPNQSEHIIRTLPVSWEITVTEATGRESCFEQTGICYSDTAATVSWSLGHWPIMDRITSLQLHGVMKVPLPCPLMYSQYQPAEDRAPFDDVDPEYGLHGYTLHIEMHNTVKSIASARFDQLSCRKDQIVNGYVQLNVIRRDGRWKHVPVSGDISLPWGTEALCGLLKDCCILSLTVLAETQAPFWCLSVPVAMTESVQMDVSYDFRGKSFSVQHQDSQGKVEMELEWEETQQQYFMVHLIVFLPITKVNKHFGRDY